MGFGTWRIRIRDPFYMQIALRTPLIEAEISKIVKLRFSWFGARREPLLVEKSTLSLCCAQCFKDYHLACRDGYNQSAQAIPRQRQLRLPLARGRWRDHMEMAAGFGVAGNREIHGNLDLGDV